MRGIAVMRGVVAAVKWFPQGRIIPGAGEYFNAAAIDRYTVTRKQDNTWSVVGRIVLSDAYKMAQRPLTFHAPHKTGEFRWPITWFEVTSAGLLHAKLGELDDGVTDGR
jgi:hypothetical protein